MHHAVRNSHLTALHLNGDADPVFCIDVGIKPCVVAVDSVLAGICNCQCKAVHARVVLGQALQQAGRDRRTVHDVVRRFGVQQDGDLRLRVDALKQLDAGVNHIFIGRNKALGFGHGVNRRSNDWRIGSVRNGRFAVDPALDVAGVEHTLEHRELIHRAVEELALAPVILLKRAQDQRFVHRTAVIGDADIGVVAHAGVRFGGHLAAAEDQRDPDFVPVEIAQVDERAAGGVEVEAQIAIAPDRVKQTARGTVLGKTAQQGVGVGVGGQGIALHLEQDRPRRLRVDRRKQLDAGVEILLVRGRKGFGRSQFVEGRGQDDAARSGCFHGHRAGGRFSARRGCDGTAALFEGCHYTAGNRCVSAGRNGPCHGLVGGVAG